ncbi:MAG: glycosyltransferase [Rhodospirillaceae bacterium]|nr:glycosyltransferase [Rhodospirillaceae bacterium]
MSNDTPWFAVRILSRDPLLTFSSSGLDGVPLPRLAAALPNIFGRPRGLHFVHTTHTMEPYYDKVAGAFDAAERAMPGHVFVPLATSEMEMYLLAEKGRPSLLGSGLIFTDERVWRIVEASVPRIGLFDAVYSARLATSKRHSLATGVPRLILVYPHTIEIENDAAYRRALSVLPNAYYANHAFGKGSYKLLDPVDVIRLFAHAATGLCLSAAEGCMRVSMEYLLCGLPVVSTRSIGGRDRYLENAYCRIVRDEPDAIAAAVSDLAGQRIDRRRIRGHVGSLLAFDRHNFLMNARKLTKRVLDRDDLLPDFAPFLGSIAEFLPLDRHIAQLSGVSVDRGQKQAADSAI